MQRTVVKTRSVEYMPFSLSFFLILNGGIPHDCPPSAHAPR